MFLQGLHYGRLIQLDRIDIEWSKKRLRRMFIQISNTRPIVSSATWDISSCRLKVHKKDQDKSCK
ncbi:hypothetical protein [Candidatus Rhabdochlamydia porcellionis]|uniref:hypothetical protein n=1 Tax=Candidatus Rhabdochlamydia porcellionis TaxID=225148 RepID=UPI001891E54C|nr:hypothetical protein [Candidatus Rhabdochlamydia porcellionis]